MIIVLILLVTAGYLTMGYITAMSWNAFFKGRQMGNGGQPQTVAGMVAMTLVWPITLFFFIVVLIIALCEWLATEAEYKGALRKIYLLDNNDN